jgi:alpha-tubulin suppressor-like RCC1 family protein
MLAAALGAVSASSCVGLQDYTCKSNDPCVGQDGAQGICEPAGYCSFADSSCPGSGRRYGDQGSGPSSGECVAAGTSCIQKLALGIEHTCALRDDGTAWCWGANDKGQLGDGTTTTRTVPTKVAGLPGPASALTAGDRLTCALLRDATVWCWGDNAMRQLGQCDGSALASSPRPVQVMGYALDPQGKPTCGKAPFEATRLSVGGKHACALAPDGNVYCWGENSTGQCGHDPKVYDDVPGPIAIEGSPGGLVDVQAGDEFTCGLKDDGTMYCWGSNKLGSLGTGSTTDSYKSAGVQSLLSVSDLVISDETGCARTSDGALWCWGNGSSGIFGTNLQHELAPVRVTTADRAFAGSVSKHLCIVSAVGELRCWGSNLKGQVGAGTLDANVFAPTAAKLVTVAEVALGEEHTCATTKDGALFCWGDDSAGELGIGATSDVPVSSPVRVPFSCSP